MGSVFFILHDGLLSIRSICDSQRFRAEEIDHVGFAAAVVDVVSIGDTDGGGVAVFEAARRTAQEQPVGVPQFPVVAVGEVYDVVFAAQGHYVPEVRYGRAVGEDHVAVDAFAGNASLVAEVFECFGPLQYCLS